MVDPGIEKHVPLGGEAVALIEPQCVSLGVEDELSHTLLCGPTQEFGEDGAANPAPTPGSQHGHSSDVPVGQQSAGPNRCARAVFGQHVQAARIRPVPLEPGRNVLLADEYGFPNAPQVLMVALPVSTTHAKGGAHAGDYNGCSCPTGAHVLHAILE